MLYVTSGNIWNWCGIFIMAFHWLIQSKEMRRAEVCLFFSFWNTGWLLRFCSHSVSCSGMCVWFCDPSLVFWVHLPWMTSPTVGNASVMTVSFHVVFSLRRLWTFTSLLEILTWNVAFFVFLQNYGKYWQNFVVKIVSCTVPHLYDEEAGAFCLDLTEPRYFPLLSHQACDIWLWPLAVNQHFRK